MSEQYIKLSDNVKTENCFQDTPAYLKEKLSPGLSGAASYKRSKLQTP